MIKSRYALGKVLSIGSSSEGNAYYVEINRKGYQYPFKLLIECGFTYSEIGRRLLKYGISINDINAVLVTHEHNDHSKAVKEMVDRGKLVFAPKEVFEKYGVLDKVSSRNIIKERSTKVIADGVQVIGFPLEHHEADGSNIVNFGYIITAECDFGKHNILFVTDTHYIKYNLRSYKFHTIFIEANNLRKNIHIALKYSKTKNQIDNIIRYTRVLNSHLLVENTIVTIIGDYNNPGFDLSKTNTIYLMHLTASSNINPLQIKKMVENSIKENNLIRKEIHNGKEYKFPRVIQFQKYGEPM